MFKRDGHIEYFDSYGEKPDAQRAWLTPDRLADLGEEEPWLTDLLKRSGYHVYYNTHAYQADKKDVNTCGMWCIARLICKDMSNVSFYNTVRASMKENGITSPDEWVTAFTANILGK